jgi:hypothetical protein
VIRSYYPAHFAYTQHTCTIGIQVRGWVQLGSLRCLWGHLSSPHIYSPQVASHLASSACARMHPPALPVQAWVPRIEPCDWPVLYLHSICASGLGVKRGIFRAAGFWFLDDDQGEGWGPGYFVLKRLQSRPLVALLTWLSPPTTANHRRLPTAALLQAALRSPARPAGCRPAVHCSGACQRQRPRTTPVLRLASWRWCTAGSLRRWPRCGQGARPPQR